MSKGNQNRGQLHQVCFIFPCLFLFCSWGTQLKLQESSNLSCFPHQDKVSLVINSALCDWTMGPEFLEHNFALRVQTRMVPDGKLVAQVKLAFPAEA